MTDSEETGAGDVLAAEVLERQKATTETETYKVGTLVLDLYDTKTKQLPIGESWRVLSFRAPETFAKGVSGLTILVLKCGFEATAAATSADAKPLASATTC